MKITRLFEIVYILLDKQLVTARELADKFEVSTRTIYRDIDVLSSCGIPIYTNKGKGGGISLLDSFKMDKTLLTAEEQSEIIAALQGIQAADINANTSALSKLSSFFNQDTTNWIDIDFSFWSSSANYKSKFETLKNSIIHHTPLSIMYSNTKGEATERIIHPVRLIFRGVSWYLLAFCTLKNDFRIFKITRISNIHISEGTFPPYTNIPDIYDDNSMQTDTTNNEMLTMRIDKSMAFRVYDDFPENDISLDSDGFFIIRTCEYDTNWIIQYILSYGEAIECISPDTMRYKIKNILHKAINNYHNMTF